jgi:DNA repair protein RecO
MSASFKERGMHKIEAIILKTQNFAETSHILSVFSKEFGIVNLLTKNYAAKIARSYSPFLKIETSVRSTEKELWKAGSIHISNSFSLLRTSLEKIELAALMAKTLNHLLPPNSPTIEVYTLFEEHLEALAKSDVPFAISTSFFLKFFYHEGLLGAIPTENKEETKRFEHLFTLSLHELVTHEFTAYEHENYPSLLQKTMESALPQFNEYTLRILKKKK